MAKVWKEIIERNNKKRDWTWEEINKQTSERIAKAMELEGEYGNSIRKKELMDVWEELRNGKDKEEEEKQERMIKEKEKREEDIRMEEKKGCV